MKQLKTFVSIAMMILAMVIIPSCGNDDEPEIYYATVDEIQGRWHGIDDNGIYSEITFTGNSYALNQMGVKDKKLILMEKGTFTLVGTTMTLTRSHDSSHVKYEVYWKYKTHTYLVVKPLGELSEMR